MRPSSAPPRRRSPGSTRVRSILALVLLGIGAVLWGAGGRQPVAVAEVVHGTGFSATVLGWTSWYGDYGMGPLGRGWCIDHGLLAPDAAFGYVPTAVPVHPDVGAAVAWAVTATDATDPVAAAAVMLAVHDLMGAAYPFGPMDVDRLTTANLGGFGGREQAVIDHAREVKRQALAHRHLRAPFRLTLEARSDGDGPEGALTALVADAEGRPVEGILVQFTATGASLGGTPSRTRADGRAVIAYLAGPGTVRLGAVASIPDPDPDTYAPTTAVAQRIARPRLLTVRSELELVPPTTTTAPPTTVPPTTPPPTTVPPTTPPPTTPPPTTVPPTTTPPTTRPPRTVPPTTTPPTTTPPTTTPPTTTPPTSAPPTTAPPETVPPSTTTAPPTTVPPTTVPPTSAAPPSTPTRGSLPFTGVRSVGAVLVGAGLIAAGLVLVAIGRRRPPRTVVLPASGLRLPYPDVEHLR